MAADRTFLPVAIFILSGVICSAAVTRVRKFPQEFYFGVSTSAHQIEGAWNESGKGENIWDRLAHSSPTAILDGSNADVSCDSYRLYRRDVQMLEELGVDFYRFSISWSRLMPTGFTESLSKDGVDYYNRLIDSLLEKGIVPMVTLHHWDLPQPLQDLGGWPNSLLADYFEDFARKAFVLFGDRVKLWATFGEPNLMCYEGYGKRGLAPRLNTSGIADYMCAHTVLQAHSRVYRIYDRQFRKKQAGMIGIILHSYWSEPSSKSYEDIRAAEQSLQFNVGWMAHPIFSSHGDYPPVMRKRVAARSSRQKFTRSRLPAFSAGEVRALLGSSDFLGLSHFGARSARAPPTSFVVPETPSFDDDRGVEEPRDDRRQSVTADWLKVSAAGFRKMLNWIRKEYRDPELIVTGNGLATSGGLMDQDRISYMNRHLNAIMDAIEDGCNVKAYAAWSLMDNFNWIDGYTKKFGLYEVDFSSPNRTRTLRDSGEVYAEIIRTRSIFSNDSCSDCDELDLSVDYNSVET